MKKFLVTGGNRGLGLKICERFNGHSISRSNGYDVLHDCQRIVDLSLDYDVFVNNAYDGVWGQSAADFGQTRLLFNIAQTWKNHSKQGHIINIGGVGGHQSDSPQPHWEMYGANKAALRFHSHQWTKAFKNNEVGFRTSVIVLDRLDTELGRTTSAWTGNGHSLEDVVDMIELCLAVQKNTCVEEITAWVNLDHKQ